MDTNFDPYVFQIHTAGGQERPELPGFIIARAPRRAQRGRMGDLLILLLTISGDSSQTNRNLDEILEILISTYYNTPGPVTTGLSAVVSRMNEMMLNINLRGSQPGRQSLAKLNLAVLRRGQLYLTHGGDTHSIICQADHVEHFQDAEIVPRALGLGRTVHTRFHKHELQAGALLILSVEPASAWTPALLSTSCQLPAEHLRRKLLHNAPQDLQAVVIRFQPGKGDIHRLRRKETSAVRAAPVRPPAPSLEQRQSTPLPAAQERPQPEAAARREKRPVPQEPQATGDVPISREVPPEKSYPLWESFQSGIEDLQTQLGGGKLRSWLAKIWQAGQDIQHRIRAGGKQLMLRMLPGMVEDVPGLPPGAMIFIAIAVPIVVVAVASTAYLRRGRTAEHERILQQAVLLASQAADQSDPVLQRDTWEGALDWIEAAESYGSSEESISLRDQVYNALDEIDGITRIEIYPAIQQEVFPPTVQITKMIPATSSSDVYLLDSSEGRVLRMILTGRGYEVDPQFNCGPGPSGTNYIDPLIAMVPLPPYNVHNATILALDGKGNLLYCLPGATPLSSSLQPPYTDWVQITDATLQYDTLYVLDIGTNAVWMYSDLDMAFGEEPRLFFGEEIPANMEQMIDLAINEDDLYLLRQNGQMAMCVFSHRDFYPTKCTDPKPYGDLRPGRTEDLLVFEEANFSHMQATRPPDPSLYLLDKNSAAVYHLSLQLNLLRQLRPRPTAGETLPDRPPTAFLVTSDPYLMFAFGNQLYYAALP